MQIDYDVQRELQPELDPTERMLWAGRPRQGVFFRRGDLFMIPFTLLWCGFAVFWVLSAAAARAPALMLLFGMVFVLVGLYFVFGRFLTDASQRRRTLYGITDQRVIIRTGSRRRELKSLSLRSLSDVSLTEYGDGRGTIRFGPASPYDAWAFGRGWPGTRAMSPQFEQIADAKEVFRVLREAQKEA